MDRILGFRLDAAPQKVCLESKVGRIKKDIINSAVTAFHRSLSKYLIAQDSDTPGTPTLTKHNRTLARLGNLLYLQTTSTIKVNWFFSVPCIE